MHRQNIDKWQDHFQSLDWKMDLLLSIIVSRSHEKCQPSYTGRVPQVMCMECAERVQMMQSSCPFCRVSMRQIVVVQEAEPAPSS